MPDPKKYKLKPASEGLLVRKPEGGYLSDKGEEVAMTTYWQRRLKEGDVVDMEAAKKEKEASAAAQKATAEEAKRAGKKTEKEA